MSSDIKAIGTTEKKKKQKQKQKRKSSNQNMYRLGTKIVLNLAMFLDKLKNSGGEIHVMVCFDTSDMALLTL